MNKKKIATTAVALTTAAALLLGGTFAWQSISQRALNEASDVINPGGRLHNDISYVDAKTTNNDIYVENFAEDDIYARVRLSEYMEIVMNYDPANPTAPQTKVENVAGSKTPLDDTTHSADDATQRDAYDYTYDIHYFHETYDEEGNLVDTNATDKYWQWDTDGSDADDVYYMPTFNVNKDSLVPDLNGLYTYRVGGISERGDDQYEEYVDYSATPSKTAEAIYDADTNSNDEVGDDLDNAANYPNNVLLVSEEHYADTVGYTNGLISMTEWLDLYYEDEDTANYWVYDDTEDEDGDGAPDGGGWVYWSSPIGEDETTGLLLDSFTLKEVMDDTWYYAIEVTGQFVTKDDAGKGDGTGFYDTNVEGNTAPTERAELFLDAIGVTLDGSSEDDEGGNNAEYYEGYAVIKTANDKTYVTLGATDVQLVAMTGENDEFGNPVTFNISEWKFREDVWLDEEYSASTSLSENGILTVGADERNGYIEIAATIADGEFAGQVINGAIGVTMPYIQIEEVNVDGQIENVSSMIAAGGTKYFKVTGVKIYGDNSDYPGYENFAEKDLTWTVAPMYPFDAATSKVTGEETENGLFKVTHTCANAEDCSCAYPLEIRATFTNDDRVSGFVTRFVSKSTSIDTMTLAVGHNVNANLQYEHTFCKAGEQIHEITAYVTENDRYINFDLGEWSVGSLIWMDESERELANGSGWLDESGEWTSEPQVSGITDMSAQSFTLDPEQQITQLTLVGKYEKNSDYSGATLNQDIRIKLRFNFVWVDDDFGGEEEEEFGIYCMTNGSVDGEEVLWYNGEFYTFTANSSEDVIWSVECDDDEVTGGDEFGDGNFSVSIGYNVPEGTEITVAAETDSGEFASYTFTVTKIKTLTLVHGNTDEKYEDGEIIDLGTLNSDYWFYTDETHRVHYSVEGSSLDAGTYFDILNYNLIIGEDEMGTGGKLTLTLVHWEDENLTSTYTLVLPTT